LVSEEIEYRTLHREPGVVATNRNLHAALLKIETGRRREPGSSQTCRYM
jgi:hypothetical protein